MKKQKNAKEESSMRILQNKIANSLKYKFQLNSFSIIIISNTIKNNKETDLELSTIYFKKCSKFCKTPSNKVFFSKYKLQTPTFIFISLL